MHPLYEKADHLSSEVIGAAIEVHRNKGPGLIESIYERCLLRELELRSIPVTTLPVMSRGVETSLDSSPTAAEIVGDSSTSLGMTKRPDEPVLKNGIFRMILPGAKSTDDNQLSL